MQLTSIGDSKLGEIKRVSLADGIELVGEKSTAKLTTSEVSLAATDAAIKTALESKAGGTLDDVHIHKAQDGTIYVATGSEPDVWPDQVADHPGDKYAEDETVLSVSSDGKVTYVPPKPPSFYGEG